MAHQGLYRVAILLILAVATEILIVTAAEGHPKQKHQPIGEYQRYLPKHLSKITGGVNATIKEFPSQVGIFFNGTFACGGTLVGSKRKHVLTAARCVSFAKPKERNLFNVVLNSSEIIVLESSTITRRLSKIVTHPRFNSSGLMNADLAILTFDNPIYVKLKPAKLEEDEDFVLNDYAGKVGVSVGWGSTQKWEVDKPTLQIDISSHLKKVNLPIISHADCVELLSQPIDITFGGRVICTKANTPEGPCEGDAGGPLFVKGVQIGIMKDFNGCGDNRAPVLFTRVAAHLDWINDQISK